MRHASSDPAARLARVLGIGALVGVVVLTLLDRGATRAYSSPWYFLLLLVQVAPLAALALRGLTGRTPFRLPPRPWYWVASVSFVVVLASALVSPYRGPSLLAALNPLAGLAAFFLLYDWLVPDPESRADRLLRLAGLVSLGIVLLSLGTWLADDLLPSLPLRSLAQLSDLRNAHPLGHSNYTAGLALLTLPWLVALAWRTRRWVRVGWSFAAVLALATLVSSASRGGIVGLAALALAALLRARLGWKRLSLYTVVAVAALLALAAGHPRTRAMLLSLTRRSTAAPLAASDLQRRAMLSAGLRMGTDRPILGWGPGTTPLAYPRYRAQLDGGVEDILQLHATPVQLWADYGALGLVCALGFLWLVAPALLGRRPLRLANSPLTTGSSFHSDSPPAAPLPAGGSNPPLSAAALALAGYGVFALTDYQLDLPIFALALAACAALLASQTPTQFHVLREISPRSSPALLGALALLALAAVAFLGRRDPTPALNLQALALARDPAQADRAAALFRRSLALNPDQEIAHFNLGWILVVRDPAAAERHFLAAARLVPDKGGVYFGLALARLNQNRPAPAAQALALECLDDPAFLASPWWRQPAIAALHPATLASFHACAERLATELAARHDPRARDASYVDALASWLAGSGHVGEMLATAQTSRRVGYFAARPAVPDFAASPIRAYHRERLGYPVLMRDLDLPTPVDLYDVQDSALAAGDLAFLFPPKGWLPAPLLLALLDSPPTPDQAPPPVRP